MGHAVDLQLDATEHAGADDPAADAAAQRHRGVEHHEKDGLAAMPPTRPLTCRKESFAGGRQRTSRYVWTNPLQRSASADGGQKDTPCAKQDVSGHGVSDVCVSVAPR